LNWLDQLKSQWRQLGQLPQQGQILRLVLSWWILLRS
jgi:hypothetical protein